MQVMADHSIQDAVEAAQGVAIAFQTARRELEDEGA